MDWIGVEWIGLDWFGLVWNWNRLRPAGKQESEKKMGVVKQQAIYAQAAISHPLSPISYFLSQ